MACLLHSLIKDRNSGTVQRCILQHQTMEHGVQNVITCKERERTERSWTIHLKVFWLKVLRNTQGDTNVGPDLCSYHPHSI